MAAQAGNRVIVTAGLSGIGHAIAQDLVQKGKRVSMLVNAALVGARDLGQQVYVALSKADAAAGLISGGIVTCVALAFYRLLCSRSSICRKVSE